MLVSMNPYPIGVMEREDNELDFIMNNKPVDVADLLVRMSMKGMSMTDMLNVTCKKLAHTCQVMSFRCQFDSCHPTIM